MNSKYFQKYLSKMCFHTIYKKHFYFKTQVMQTLIQAFLDPIYYNV